MIPTLKNYKFSFYVLMIFLAIFLAVKIFCCNFALGYGALAHLARAFDWQSRGDQFESGMLH